MPDFSIGDYAYVLEDVKNCSCIAVDGENTVAIREDVSRDAFGVVVAMSSNKTVVQFRESITKYKLISVPNSNLKLKEKKKVEDDE